MMKKKIAVLVSGGGTNLGALIKAQNFNEDNYFNASALYSQGLSVHKDINCAKQVISNAFSSNYDVIFTSCGTESDNTAIFSYSKRGNMVTTLGSQIKHLVFVVANNFRL